MLALTLDFFEVLVLLSLEAEVLSWTRMVRISPTLRARLSANMDRDESAFQSEPISARAARAGTRRSTTTEASRSSAWSAVGTAKGNCQSENRRRPPGAGAGAAEPDRSPRGRRSPG